MNAETTATTDFNFGEKAVEAFTQGDCWLLSMSLNKLTGLPMVVIGDGDITDIDDYELGHVAVMIDDRNYADITGIHDLTEGVRRNMWGTATIDQTVVTNFLDAYIEDGGCRYFDENPDEYAIRIASALLERGVKFPKLALAA